MAAEFNRKQFYGMDDLLEIMRLLRGENGCPWDREQTHRSIRKNLIEETYEVAEAIDTDDSELLCEELGDLLLQIVLHSRIEEEAGRFAFEQVCDGICKKLILRHPHVFGEVTVSNTEQVLANWDAIKERSKGQTTATETLKSVPAVLPALMRSEKVQRRAAKVGFDYPDLAWAMRDLDSELAELREAAEQGDQQHIDEELGDLLFSAVNVARFVGSDPEESLSLSCEKFIRRFAWVELLAKQEGLEMKTASIEQLDALWQQAKHMLL